MTISAIDDGVSAEPPAQEPLDTFFVTTVQLLIHPAAADNSVHAAAWLQEFLDGTEPRSGLKLMDWGYAHVGRGRYATPYPVQLDPYAYQDGDLYQLPRREAVETSDEFKHMALQIARDDGISLFAATRKARALWGSSDPEPSLEGLYYYSKPHTTLSVWWLLLIPLLLASLYLNGAMFYALAGG